MIYHDSQALHCQEFFRIYTKHMYLQKLDYGNTLDIPQLVLTIFLLLSCQVLSHADDLIATLVHLLEYVKHLTHPRGVTSQLCDLCGVHVCVHMNMYIPVYACYIHGPHTCSTPLDMQLDINTGLSIAGSSGGGNQTSSNTLALF